FLTINYDGAFEETTDWAVLAATPTIQGEMRAYLKHETGLASGTLGQAIDSAIRTWAVGSMAQSKEQIEENEEETKGSSKAGTPQPAPATQDKTALLAHLREVVAEKTIECAVLERTAPGSSKYRTLKADELGRLLPKTLQQPA